VDKCQEGRRGRHSGTWEKLDFGMKKMTGRGEEKDEETEIRGLGAQGEKKRDEEIA